MRITVYNTPQLRGRTLKQITMADLLQQVVDIHLRCSTLRKPSLFKHFLHLLLEIEPILNDLHPDTVMTLLEGENGGKGAPRR